jgi:hypothetical protein
VKSLKTNYLVTPKLSFPFTGTMYMYILILIFLKFLNDNKLDQL